LAVCLSALASSVRERAAGDNVPSETAFDDMGCIYLYGQGLYVIQVHAFHEKMIKFKTVLPSYTNVRLKNCGDYEVKSNVGPKR
jgi:hypothetical protein